MGARGPISRNLASHRHVGSAELCDEPPAVVDADELAGAEWGRVVPLLKQTGSLQALDLAVLVGYCLAYSEFVRAQAVLNREGMTFEANGMIRQRPEVGIADKAARRVRMLAVELGLSPAARLRLKVPAPQTVEEDEFDRFLREA